MRLGLVTALAVVYLANFSTATQIGVISSKNSVETKKIRGLISFEDADPKPLGGSHHTANLSASEESALGWLPLLLGREGEHRQHQLRYRIQRQHLQPKALRSNSEDDDDGFWESFKDWLFDDDSS
ncbi:hypothetical protein V7S43_017463 [Phytophthora oleae]|uniref:RxLR effector protein n=1 Tax=Phytophthora oleae TaxID=2107226 RepID=A0ABD3EU11_9STRA